MWSIPGLNNFGSGAGQQIVKAVTGDWQLSGIWTATTPGRLHHRYVVPEQRR